MNTMAWTYDGDRDCPGNPGRLFGCRCQVHRPDLHINSAAANPIPLTVTPTNTNGTSILPLSGVYVVSTGAQVVPYR